MARPEKVAVVEEIRTKLDESDAAVLTEYRGLTVHELAELRASLRPSGTQYKVFKNTLARRAIEGRGLDEITDLLRGPGGDRVRARRRRGCGQGAARLRQEPRSARPEGRPARRAGHHRRRDLGAGRAAVPRGAPHPDRRSVPAAAQHVPPDCSRPSRATSPTACRPSSTSASPAAKPAPVEEAPADEAPPAAEAPAEEAPAAEAEAPAEEAPAADAEQPRLHPSPSPPSPSNWKKRASQWQP